MILSRIIGGLGNQMFQYAVGRALSLRLSSSLRLDVTGFDGYGLHQGFELSHLFVCNPEIATEDDVRNLLGWRASRLARKIMFRPGFKMLHGASMVVEPYFHYWPGIKLVSRNIYIAGYWQSEKYFSDASEAIRSDFAFKAPFSKKNIDLSGRISQTTAVSLHVRRGDYLADKKTNSAHGLCSLDYYRQAVVYISNKIERPEFFVFSDDIAWVKENLVIDFPCMFVDHNNGSESYNDMRLMSLCKHHIIANSSFSWWGAWLNPNPDKIVVAPRRWFARDANIEDLFPSGWVIL